MELNLESLKPETKEYLTKNPEQLPNVVNIGVTVLSMATTSKDMDFVKAETQKIISSLGKTVDNLILTTKEQIEKILAEKFDNDLAGSYTSKFGNFLNEKLKGAMATLELKLETAKDLFNRIEVNTSEKDGAPLDKLKKQIQQVEDYVRNTFDPDNKKSIGAQVEGLMVEVLGKIDENIKTVLRTESTAAQEPLMKSIGELRDLITKQQGKDEIYEKTSGKGFDFEDELFVTLQNIAKNYGDTVERTGLEKVESGGQKGDFLYTIASINTKIVIEAKDQDVMLKPIQDYMKTALQQRGLHFGIALARHPHQLQKQIGRWNMYNDIMIGCADDIEMSLKVARTVLMLRTTKQDGLNVGDVESKLNEIIGAMKNFTNIKTNLTNMKNGIDKGTEAILKSLDDTRAIIDKAVTGINAEIKK